MKIDVMLSCYKDEFNDIALKMKEYSIKTVGFLINEYPNFQNVEKIFLSLSFVNDSQIKELNNIWRKMDKPTDVLSFPNFSDMKNEKPFHNCTLGDVIIAIPYSNMMADDLKIPLLMHITHLMVHGVLHLFGYDHYDDYTEKDMNLKTFQIMKMLGFSEFKIQ